MKQAELHLLEATKARSYLKSQVADSKEAIQAAYTTIPPTNSNISPCSKDITVHYAFDFAQQVHRYLRLVQNNTLMCTCVGALSTQPSTAWANLFPHSEEMWDFWSVFMRPYLGRQVDLSTMFNNISGNWQ